MAKMTKDELINLVNEKVADEDLAIELIENITDSMEVDSENPEKEALEKEIEEVKLELETNKTALQELKTKYKERFLKGSEEEPPKDVEASDSELKEEEVIDVKEI